MSGHNKPYKIEYLFDHTEDARVDKGKKSDLKVITELWNKPYGLTANELSKYTHIRRSSIYPITKRLIEKGLVYQPTNDKKFYLTVKAAEDPYLQSVIFSQESVREIMNSFTHFMSSNYSKEYEEDAIKEIEIRNRLSNCVNPKEKTLLEFAMDMGALITYVMLKAMEHSKEQDKSNYSDNSLTWVKYSINPIVILIHFERICKDIIKRQYLESTQNKYFDSSKPNKNESINKSVNSNNKSYSTYQMNEDSFFIIKKAFREIWPYTFDALEDIQLRIPKIVEKGIGSAYKNTKTIEKLKKSKENN